ncbi:MAG TPA: hypothetical protein VIA62_27280 [Thermoanaerobaculia bacterium]|jgi:hypothetical protein|nr:hypothetical protein [Thermoanaerobaculia bacterium]
MTPTDHSREPSPSSRPWALWVLLLLLAVWGGWFIYRTSFVLDGRRFFCLFDDAMISMTYARNLLEGHGLNWARWGEPVEGFTHPLWTFLMVPINALPLHLRHLSLLVQLMSLACLGATVAAVRRLVLDCFSGERARSWLPAAVLTAFYYPLLYWSLVGMESGLQALLTVLAVHLSLAAVHSGRDRHLALWLVCTAAFLLRMDMLLLVAAVQLYLLLRGGLRPAGRRSWLGGLAVFAGAALAYGLFRWFYFHDLLPNTYYLKLHGIPLVVRLLRGLSLMAVFLRVHLALLLVAALGTGAVLSRHRRLALPAAVVALYFAYSVYVGGDVWEKDISVRANRFVVFVMPLLFVLLNALLNLLLDGALAAWHRRREDGPEGFPAQRFVVAALAAAALLSADGLWFSDDAEDNWENALATRRPPLVENQREVMGQTLAFLRLLKPQAVVATAWAGIPAYFTHYRMIDILGYNDRVIARRPPIHPLDEDSFESFIPGHDKYDEHRLLEEQRPDGFFQIWGIRKELGLPTEVMPRYGYRKVGGFWLRADSPYLLVPLPPPEPPAPAGPRPGAGGHRRRPRPDPQTPPQDGDPAAADQG